MSKKCTKCPNKRQNLNPGDLCNKCFNNISTPSSISEMSTQNNFVGTQHSMSYSGVRYPNIGNIDYSSMHNISNNSRMPITSHNNIYGNNHLTYAQEGITNSTFASQQESTAHANNNLDQTILDNPLYWQKLDEFFDKKLLAFSNNFENNITHNIQEGIITTTGASTRGIKRHRSKELSN